MLNVRSFLVCFVVVIIFLSSLELRIAFIPYNCITVKYKLYSIISTIEMSYCTYYVVNFSLGEWNTAVMIT